MNYLSQITGRLGSRHPRNTTPAILLAAILLAVVPGCALTNPTNPYSGPPRQVTNSYATAPRAAVHSVEGPLTLTKAIHISLANNPDLAAARSGIDVATAHRDLAVGARLPNIHLVNRYSHSVNSQRIRRPSAPGESLAYTQDEVSSDIVLSMPIFAGGRLISEIDAAELLQAASEDRLAHNRQELIYNLSSVFYRILSQRSVIESLQFSQRTLKQHRDRVVELIAAQKAAKVDRLRTEVRIADLEQRLVRERNVLAIQRRVLSNLLGIHQTSTEPVDITGELVVGSTVKTDVTKNLASALHQRRDYLAAQAALEAQAKRVDAARAGHYPTLSLQASYGGRWAAGTTAHPPGSNTSEDVGYVGLVLDIPLYEGGQIRARIRRERAYLSTARAKLRKLELQIRLDVETAILNRCSSLERVKATEKSIEQAQESLRIEREKYDLGKGTITDILDAQSALLTSQTNYYRALADYNTALAQFHLAVGEKQ